MRKLEIDTLRGLACLLLVLYHTIGNSSSNGLKLHEHWLSDVNSALSYIRMPMFAIISGYVYACKPFNYEFKRFIIGKFNRLIVPMLLVGTAFAIVQTIIPGSNSEKINFTLLHIKPVGHFWFLESMFIIFLLMMILESVELLSNKFNFSAVFLISAALYKIDTTNYFGLYGVTYLLPFFLSGLYVKRFTVEKRVVAPSLIAIPSAYLLIVSTSYTDTIGLVLGISFGVSLLYSKLRNTSLAYIGKYSFTIYLLHVFFTAFSRMFLYKIGVTNIYLLTINGLAFGILGPITISIFYHKLKTVNLKGTLIQFYIRIASMKTLTYKDKPSEVLANFCRINRLYPLSIRDKSVVLNNWKTAKTQTNEVKTLTKST